MDCYRSLTLLGRREWWIHGVVFGADHGTTVKDLRSRDALRQFKELSCFARGMYKAQKGINYLCNRVR